MKLSGLMAFKAALTLLGLVGVSECSLTTIEPCPSATRLSHAPITVSTQYQPVSTCNPTTACARGHCWTSYSFTTYPYVSTVVPCAWNGTTTQMTTVTDIHQPFRASEYREILTQVTAVPSTPEHHVFWLHWFGRQHRTTTQTTLYETVTRRAVAPFNEVGPLAIPGFDGSGLCHKCVGGDGSHAQLLAVMECRFGTNLSGKKYRQCAEWDEIWVEEPPTSTVVEAICSSAGTIPKAGVYTWTFPQVAPPITTITTTTVTVTVNGRPSITVQPSVRVIPGQSWNAHVTRSFSGPTTFRFEVQVTKVIVLNIPFVTRSAGTPCSVSVPTQTGGNGGQNQGSDWWPLPGGDGWIHTSKGSQAWQDWNPTSPPGGSSTTSRPQTSTTSSTTSPGTSSPTGPSTSSSDDGGAIGSSSSGSTATSTSSSADTATSNASSSSSSAATSASTTSTASVTPSGAGFYLQVSGTPVTAALRARQTVVGYLGFDNFNNGIVVDDLSSAALVFQGSDGTTFFSNDRFLGTASRITSLVQRFLDFPSGFAIWDILGNFAQLRDTAGFCFNNGFVFAYLESDLCENPIVLVPTNPSTSTTTAATSTDAGTASTSITSTTEVSATTTATESSSITPTSSSSPSSSTGSDGSSESSVSAASSTLTSVTSTETSESTPTGTSTGASTDISTGGSTASSTEGSTESSSTSSTEGSSTESSTASSTEGSNTSSTEASTASSTESSTASSTEDSSASSTEGSATSSAETSTASSTEGSTTSSTEASTASSTEDSATSSTEGSGASSTEDSTTSSTEASTGASTGASSSPADSTSSTPLESTTTFVSTTASSTTSSAATTTTSSSPICDLTISVCLNSQLISANSIVTYDCPLLGGLLCSLNDLLSAIPQILGQNPDVGSVLVGDNQVIGLSLTPEQVSAAFDLGELDDGACDLLGGPTSVVLRDPTCPDSPSTSTTSSLSTQTTDLSSTSTPPSETSTSDLSTLSTDTLSSTSSPEESTTTALATTTSELTTLSTTTTTSAAATSTTAAPQCNSQIEFCAALVVPWTVMLQACPNVLGCSDAQMQAFANSFIGQSGVESVAYANNIAYGFSLTTSELQDQLDLLGPINTLCTAIDIFTLQISDATCPATPLPAQQCDVDVAFCLTESLESAGITSGTCSNGILPCLPSQVTDQAIEDCNALGSACQAYGNSLLVPLTASQSVAQIQQSIAAFALNTLCVVGTTVTLSDSSC
ncbi:hypothetical protein PV04_08937 [Phialophora macrospora]|uniref:Uncharacterized protein n=1 Tax=Phialophora macrospora TaxID=1851006 RepID=A0A0D2DP14_9EURO|nr:hypothetical protein PV04_08937 [Phialophora macrospora]